MKRRLLLCGLLALLAVPAAGQEADTPFPFAALQSGEFGMYVSGFATGISDDDASLYLERRALLGGVTTESARFPAGAGREIGVRGLLWYRSLAFGVEFSRFGTDNCCLHLNVLPTTVFGGWRLPQPLLARHGHGLHPYALLGISQTMIDGNATLGSISTGIDVGPNLFSTAEPNLSPFMAAGVEWRLGEKVGLLVEYRRRRFEFDEVRSNSWIFPTENVITEGNLAASGVTLGLVWYPSPPRSPAVRDTPPADGGQAAPEPEPASEAGLELEPEPRTSAWPESGPAAAPR